MEKFDVAVIGGGSAGLAALQQLSSLGKQGVLIEAGRTPGCKNVSGGILYSKKPKSGKVYNVEDVYGKQFFQDAPTERLITKYILHATSKDKVYSVDLTAAHKYLANFGYSVLLNHLNSWFAERANETAEKVGGGIVSGVHVRNIAWRDGRTVIETDELKEFEVKAIIAADGVNSEIAYMTGARQKFSPEELYQGVKVTVKLPEEIINERFEITSEEGAAHLFVGDITLNHIGGGFLYTNRGTLSIGVVYHYDSLMNRPMEPYKLVNALLMNPLVKELMKDEVPVNEMGKNLSEEDQLKTHFRVSRLLKSWDELRGEYHSVQGRSRLIQSGKYKDVQEIRDRLNVIYQDLTTKYGTRFVTDYVELEYSAKLVPDGKRCRMKRPFFKNILFVGDSAGSGIFVGPRIEGLNVGIDDAVRAANAVARSIERNNFSSDYMGEFYTKSVQDGPYTRDMREIDKDYLKIFLDAAKGVPKDIIGSKYGRIIRLMSSGTLRSLAVGVANILGYDRLLPIVESEDTYIRVPIELAERLGNRISSTYTPRLLTIEQRIANLKYDDDSISHIKVVNPRSEFMKKMVVLCPTRCYSLECDEVTLQHEGCIECGTCLEETQWKHPRGEKGVAFQFG